MPSLHWIGKDKVVNHHHDVPFKIMEHQYSYVEGNQSDLDSKSGNKIIHGDNLEAIKALLPEYEGKIKCIYIDPPYNTGNENWVYNDNVNHPKIKKWLHQVVGKEGEDLSRHDKWLCMMYPRLKLLHKLLREDGVIFISIDDNEQANLKLIMDEIFGSGNFVSELIWDLGTGTQAGHFVRSHEKIFCYAKNKSQVPNFSGGEGFIEHSALKKISIKNPASDFIFPKGTRIDSTTDFELKEEWGGSEKTYLVEGQFICESGKLKEEVTLKAGWAMKNQMLAFFSGEDVFDTKGQRVKEFYFNKNGILRYIKERGIINPPTVLRGIASTKNGTDEIELILNDKDLFSFPKPSLLIKFLLTLVTNPNTNDIILDSFAGSGTTAHAVLNLNKQDGGNRKFILIEMEDYAEIITAERVKRVIAGYGNKEGTGGSFDYYTLGERLFDERGNLNEDVGVERIRQYVYFTETRQYLTPNPLKGDLEENQYLMGINSDTAYYFYYERDQITTLDHDFLATIKTKTDCYVIYADNCILSKEFLAKYNIIFKKIPRDISRL